MVDVKWICTEDDNVSTGNKSYTMVREDIDTIIKGLFDMARSMPARNPNPGPLILRDLPLSFYIPPILLPNHKNTYVTVATTADSLKIVSVIGTWEYTGTDSFQRPQQLNETPSEIKNLLKLKSWVQFTDDQDIRLK